MDQALPRIRLVNLPRDGEGLWPRLWRRVRERFERLRSLIMDPTPVNTAAAQTGSQLHGTNTLTLTASADNTNFVTGYSVAIAGGSAGSDITVQLKDGTTVLHTDVIGSGAVTGSAAAQHFSRPFQMTKGKTTTLVVSDGGVGVTTYATLFAYQR